MDIENLRILINTGKIKWSTHCLERMQERDISRAEVKRCIIDGEIIEDYPDDFPHPSCLIYCIVDGRKALHVVAGTDGLDVIIITAYVPNTLKFEADLKTRKK